MKKTKGQAVMEFLMTYGWVIIIVLVVISSLAYFGVLESERFLPESCIASSGLSCEEFRATSNGVTLMLRNSLGKDITVETISIQKTNCLGVFNITHKQGYVKRFDINCDLSDQKSIKSDFEITYFTPGGIKHTKQGSLVVLILKNETIEEEIPSPPPINETPQNVTCIDLDGFNYYLKSMAQIFVNGTLTGSLIDNCHGAYPYALSEMYCTDNGTGTNMMYNCPTGCFDGACINETSILSNVTENCIDTDNGIDYYTKGNVTYNLKYSEEFHNSFSDWCHDSNGLTERFCSNSSIYQINFTPQNWPQTTYTICPNGCFDGACINETTQQNQTGLIQITTNTADQLYPKIYGDKIVWQDYRSGVPNIYMYDLSTNTEQRIAISTATQIFPRIYDNKIVWQDSRNGNWDIYMYDLSTGQETQITTDTTVSQSYPAIYRDKIVWTDYRNGNADIYMYDLSTGQETQITTDTAIQYRPEIYGDKIVWSDNRNGNYDIYVYDLSTGQETQITTDTVDQWVSDIHGYNIVWIDLRNGNNYDLYLYELAIGREIQITTDTENQWVPAIYGDKIVRSDLKNGYYDIYVYDLYREQETQITTDKAVQENPDIYGDAIPVIRPYKIVWQDYRNGNWDIYMTTVY